jgi:hypothetical protein
MEGIMGKRGERLRPCHVCGDTVKFVLWDERTKKERRRIFHWANEDGSHHVHRSEYDRPYQPSVRERFVPKLSDDDLKKMLSWAQQKLI